MPDFVYDEEVAARYDKAVPLQDGEVEFYLELAREAESRGLPTLELACGTGRVALPLVRAGVRLTGLDVSTPMLALAREKSAGLENVRWLERDMRAFDLGEQFGLIFIAVGTFQLLIEIEDQLACLRCVHKHLAPEGRFAFEVESPNIVAMAEWLTTKRGALVRNPSRDHQDPKTGRLVQSWGTIDYHPSRQERTSSGFNEELDEAGVVVRRQYGQPMTLRYFHRYEMEHLLARAGFAVEAMYGDLRKNPYRGNSPDMIWVAKRA
jgi:SAM-dependent methyltransferase